MGTDLRPPDPGDLIGQTIERPAPEPAGQQPAGSTYPGTADDETGGTSEGGRPLRPVTAPGDETVYRTDPAFGAAATAAGPAVATANAATQATDVPDGGAAMTADGEAALPGIASLVSAGQPTDPDTDRSVESEGDGGEFSPPERWATAAAAGDQGPAEPGLEHMADEARARLPEPATGPASANPGSRDPGAEGSDGTGDVDGLTGATAEEEVGADHAPEPDGIIGRGVDLGDQHGRGEGDGHGRDGQHDEDDLPE